MRAASMRVEPPAQPHGGKLINLKEESSRFAPCEFNRAAGLKGLYMPLLD
jgi:hypothetical protein